MLDLTEYPSTVISKRVLARDVIELEVQLGHTLPFKEGQYIQFVFDYTFRSYSMVNMFVADSLVLTFCIKLVEDGIGSEYIEKLQIGDAVSVRGPYGDFVLADDSKDILLVATSTGIAPIIAMLKSLILRSSPQRVDILFGLRSEQDIFYHEELSKLAHANSNINFVPMLSRPAGAWKGERGRVTDYIKAHPEIAIGRASYLCGSQAMVTDVRDIVIKLGQSPLDVHQEIFN